MRFKKPSKNIIKIGLLIFILILVVLFIVNYREVSILRDGVSGLNNIFGNTTIIFLFYLVIIITFKDSLNIKNITLKIFGRVSLMMLSAYFSYSAFKRLDVPEFFAVTGGMGFVIGVLEAKKNLKKTARLRKDYKVGWSYLFYSFATVMAVVLDISMTASDLVSGEGKTAIKYQTFHDYSKIELARAKKAQAEFLKSLTDGGNFNNAKYHSEKFALTDSLTNSTKENKKDSTFYFGGYIGSGFNTLTGDQKKARTLTSLFILVVSCAITILMVSFEDDDDFDIRGYKPKSIKNRNLRFGFDVAGLKVKAENENVENERQNENNSKSSENFSSNFHKIRKLGNERRKEKSENVKMKVKEAVDLGYNNNAQIAKLKGINITGQRVGQIRKELGI